MNAAMRVEAARATLSAYFGRHDPEWALTAAQLAAVVARVRAVVDAGVVAPTPLELELGVLTVTTPKGVVTSIPLTVTP